MKKIFIVLMFVLSLSALPITVSAAGNNKNNNTTSHLLSLGAEAYIMGYYHASRGAFKSIPSSVESYCSKVALKFPIVHKFYFDQECINGVLAYYQISRDMNSHK